MDSRIEELADVILERAKGVADKITGSNEADEYRAYRRIEWLAVEMLKILHMYRVEHPEKYL